MGFDPLTMGIAASAIPGMIGAFSKPKKYTPPAPQMMDTTDPYYADMLRQFFGQPQADLSQYRQPYGGQLEVGQSPLLDEAAGMYRMNPQAAPNMYQRRAADVYGGFAGSTPQDFNLIGTPAWDAYVNRNINQRGEQLGMENSAIGEAMGRANTLYGSGAQNALARAAGKARTDIGEFLGSLGLGEMQRAQQMATGLQQVAGQGFGALGSDIENQAAQRGAGYRAAGAGLAGLGGIQMGNEEANLMRAYQDWQRQQQMGYGIDVGQPQQQFENILNALGATRQQIYQPGSPQYAPNNWSQFGSGMSSFLGLLPFLTGGGGGNSLASMFGNNPGTGWYGSIPGQQWLPIGAGPGGI